jgi:ribonuclease BN (tRNA processing enzyme)
VVDGSPYLIDVGVGFLRNPKAAGYNGQDIDAVFITHHHLDHDGGLNDFIEYSSFGRRNKPLSIVGPLGTEQMTHGSLEVVEPSRRIFGSEGLPKADPNSLYQSHDISGPGVVYQDAKIKVTAAENSHYSLIKPDSPSAGYDKSYAYRVETPSGSIVFSGDTGPSNAVAMLAQDADILVIEVMDVAATIKFVSSTISLDPASRQMMEDHMKVEHLTPEEVGKLAVCAEVKMVVLTHFGPGADSETSTEPYVKGIRKYYHGPVLAGRDLNEIDLPF